MLRLSLRRCNSITVASRRLPGATVPSPTTTVLLRDIPSSATETSLRASLQGINFRKVEMEPGCAIHLATEAEANYASSILQKKYGSITNVSSTTMPSLTLQNLPSTVHVERLASSFSKHQPKIIRMAGQPMIQVLGKSAEDAVKISRAIANITVGNRSLRSTAVKMPDDSFAVQVYNFENMAEAETAVKTAVEGSVPNAVSTLRTLPGAPKSAVLRFNPKTEEETKVILSAVEKVIGDKKTSAASTVQLKKPTLFIRNVRKIGPVNLQKVMEGMGAERLQINYTSKDIVSDLAVAYFSSEEAAFAALSKLRATKVEGNRLPASYREIAEPAVTVKNIPASYTEEKIAELFSLYRPARIEMIGESGSEANKTALVVMGGPADADLAVKAMNKRKVDGQSLEVIDSPIYDLGVELKLEQDSLDISKISTALKAAGVDVPKASIVNTNISAFLSFMSVEEAVAAHYSFVDGATIIEGSGGSGGEGVRGGLVSSRVSVQPSYVLEVGGLDVEMPTSQIQSLFGVQSSAPASSSAAKADETAAAAAATAASPEAAPSAGAAGETAKDKKGKDIKDAKGGKDSKDAKQKQQKQSKDSKPAAAGAAANAAGKAPTGADVGKVLPIDILRLDRSAVVKFKRHSDIVYGMKQLKGVAIDGQHMRVSRCRPVTHGGTHEIDELGEDEEFDQYSLRTVMNDYMYADPATRYEIAKNYFERAVNDAKATGNASIIVDPSAGSELKSETEALLKKKKLDQATLDRLFDIYIQREDLANFSHDFREMEAYLGPANPEDSFDWSQFRIEDWQDILRLREAMKKSDEKFMQAAARASGHNTTTDGTEAAGAVAGAGAKEGSVDGKQGEGMKVSASGKEILIKGDSGEEETISLEDPSMLRDKEGRLWSGAILDTDMVQKTMPGGRVGTHRALVVVGNLKGAAGFGMGKGKTSGDAVNAAFRDALRNLVFIDIYDKFGLAHDLHGKHNSCHAYIRATPRSRTMVASPFATAVLTRFGIGSASVKLVGRRDPYAMIRAMFNALQQHENIDEFAKDRGKRYLTLKWIYDNNV